jgi:hypothetical protein
MCVEILWEIKRQAMNLRQYITEAGYSPQPQNKLYFVAIISD